MFFDGNLNIKSYKEKKIKNLFFKLNLHSLVSLRWNQPEPSILCAIKAIFILIIKKEIS